MITAGIPGDCNTGDGCNYAPLISGTSFTTGHVYCAIGQSQAGSFPTFEIYYGHIAFPEMLWHLGTCTPSYRFAAGSYMGSSSLNPHELDSMTVVMIAPTGYTPAMAGYPVTVTIAP